MKPVRITRKNNTLTGSPNGLPVFFVGRVSAFSNPFRVVQMSFNQRYAIKITPMEDQTHNKWIQWILINYTTYDYETKPEAMQVAKNCYERFLNEYASDIYKQKAIQKLKGKNLSCYCHEDEPCHADVLLEFVNQTQ